MSKTQNIAQFDQTEFSVRAVNSRPAYVMSLKDIPYISHHTLVTHGAYTLWPNISELKGSLIVYPRELLD